MTLKSMSMAMERIQIPIDRFGRVVLPKKLRERLNLQPGTELEVEETEDAILLKPISKKAKIINKGGVWVISTGGPPITQEQVNETMERIRKEREERFLK
jgi:AbrB family looped-hinge helix DNA binding protein